VTVLAPQRTGQVTVLRAGAALLVVYSYLVGLWLQQHGANPQPIAGLREWLNRPLRAGEDFGPVAIMVLLLCAGWTTAGARCRPRDLLRTALPLLVAVPFAPAPVAWVIGLQAIAWLVGLDRSGWRTPVVLLAGIGVLAVFDTLGLPALLTTLVLIGRVTRRVADGHLPAWVGLTLGACCFAAIAVLDRTAAGLATWWYPVAATYAVLVFLAVVLGPPVPDLAVTRWLADRAEWLLVLSGVVGFAVLTFLHPRVPLSAATLGAIAATGLTADLAHRLTRPR
jgi:hypothetical protein